MRDRDFFFLSPFFALSVSRNNSMANNFVHLISFQTPLTDISHHRYDPVLATCGHSLASLWDLTLQANINDFEWGVDTVHCVRFNQVETNLLAASASDRSIILYDTRETR